MTPRSQPMSPADRALLERRYALETRNGRVLVGMHLVMLCALLVVFSLGGKDRRAWVFLSALVGLSGAGWLLWMSLFFARMRGDLAGGVVEVGETRLARKRYYRTWRLRLEPALPQEWVRVHRALYDALEEGAELRIRWFPRSKVLAAVERLA